MNRSNVAACAIVLLALAGLSAGCSKDHNIAAARNGRDPADGGVTPPVPVIQSVAVGNRSLTLTWKLPDSSLAAQVRSYRVYQRTATQASPDLADSARSSPATVSDLTNGSPIRFSLSAVLANGLEGRRSAEVEASPGLFTIVLDGGKLLTNSRSVQVTPQAPAGATGVTLGSQPDLSDGVTFGLQPSLSFTLDPGDGQKTVYGRFVDGAGNPSQIVSAQIRLDTRAEISAFDFDGLDTRAPGDTIVFTLNGGEANGTAQVEITRGGNQLPMRDDGIAPDRLAGDGIYTLRYIAQESQQFLGAEMIGHFTDEAGNVATEHPAPRRLTVHALPPALTLDPPTSAGPDQIQLSWSRAPDGVSFASYRLYRGERPHVDTLRTRKLVSEITTRSQTSFSDTGLETGRTYYYRVELVDQLGFAGTSNEVDLAPGPNAPPTAVVLAPPFNVTEKSVSLSWSQNQDADFASYRVVRGEHRNVLQDATRRILTEIPNHATTTTDDQTDLEQGRTYHYVIVTVDNLGATTASNEDSATVKDIPPVAVTLSGPPSPGPASVDMSWTQNSELDFASYRLYRARQSGVTEDSSLVQTLTEASQTRWLDSGLQDNTDYYYRVFVHDKGGNVTPSNEVKVTTANLPPPAVTLNAPTEQDPNAPTPAIILTWSASQVHDFKEYRIYRDTAPGVGEGATLVRAIDAIGTTSFTDSDSLRDDARYYYRVFVHDTANPPGSTGSNEPSIVTANRPPAPVTLTMQTGQNTTVSISLTWTSNGQADFDHYAVVRGTAADAITDTLATFPRRDQTAYTDFPQPPDPNQNLFYKVVVWDRSISGGPSLSSDSNIVVGHVTS